MKDFYEEDEPVADVIAAFDRGEQGVTAPPTDRDRLIRLLRSFGVEPQIDPPDVGRPEGMQAVRLRAKNGGVLGYSDFLCDFLFTPEGKFDSVGVWE